MPLKDAMLRFCYKGLRCGDAISNEPWHITFLRSKGTFPGSSCDTAAEVTEETAEESLMDAKLCLLLRKQLSFYEFGCHPRIESWTLRALKSKTLSQALARWSPTTAKANCDQLIQSQVWKTKLFNWRLEVHMVL